MLKMTVEAVFTEVMQMKWHVTITVSLKGQNIVMPKSDQINSVNS
jgi:hypothetical protein